jgi:rubrerythrin
MELDYRALTPADALDLAVLIEEQTRQRYLELVDALEADRAEHPALAFFRTMAEHEKRHGLELLRRRERLYPDAPTRVTAELLENAEIPERDALTVAATPRECMDLVMTAERNAEAFFRHAVAEIDDPEVATLFSELADEEIEHQRMVAAQLAAL